ncbi:putative Site-specific DNA methylase [Magnetospirillum sp. XM-1]|uniref:DNA adenine methylase n=1 Tax=Magnetospirillum sp. XM-1 TaxID=1663591 RepID=UPI00073DC975|nr:DNA adenine methylase [Magnetospirillum sp. XM-1]CUW37530.1 putative Site-specific DNA methylase [Magnetospirillum sp. XM-1]
MAIFRYPGGKERGKQTIISFIPDDVDEVCSPFLGGGAVELDLGQRGIRVHGYDLFEPLVNCWQQIGIDAGAVADAARQYHPLDRDGFYRFQQSYFDIPDPVTQAAAFFALNRSSFSGLTFSGGYSGTDNRFTLSSIDKLARTAIPNIIVEEADFATSLSRHPGTFVYADPPYLLPPAKATLYGFKGDAHRDFDHRRLADVLRSRPGCWLLSYNDAPAVRRLYEGFAMVAASWTYGTGKVGAELLIFSNELADAVGMTPLGRRFGSSWQRDDDQIIQVA